MREHSDVINRFTFSYPVFLTVVGKPKHFACIWANVPISDNRMAPFALGAHSAQRSNSQWNFSKMHRVISMHRQISLNS